MQVAAAPPQLASATTVTQQQSPLSNKSDPDEWDNLSLQEKMARQMDAYDRLGKEVGERMKKGIEKKEQAESQERKELLKRHLKEQQQKQENERKECHQKEISAANVASQNGGFQNGINAIKQENQRKRKAEDDPFHPSKAMMNNAQHQQQQQWQMQQMHQSQMYQQAQMMQFNSQRIPNSQMYPNFAPYPPCAASTSNGDHHQNSPVVPSVSQASSITTPPQAFGQVDQQGPTPPALVQHQSPVNDLVTSNDFDGLDKWATEIQELTDLGNMDELDDLLGDPSSSSNNGHQQQGPPSNVVSPQDGYQMPVNGPQSAHSISNPMSNGPPMTPTSMTPMQQQQPAQQQTAPMVQQFPGIGNPMFSSTPKNPLGMPDPSGMPSQMPNLQSPHAMASPHMAPAMHSPHMGNLQSPGLPPQMMTNPAMAGQQNPMSMTPNPMSNPMAMGNAWGQSQPWGGAPSGAMPPGGMNGYPPSQMMGMGYGAAQMSQAQMRMQQEHQQRMQAQFHQVQMFLRQNPPTLEENNFAEQEAMKMGELQKVELARRFPNNAMIQQSEWARYCQMQKVHICYCVVMKRMKMMEHQRKQWLQHQQQQQMMAPGLPSPNFAPYPPYPGSQANYMSSYPPAPIQ